MAGVGGVPGSKPGHGVAGRWLWRARFPWSGRDAAALKGKEQFTAEDAERAEKAPNYENRQAPGTGLETRIFPRRSQRSRR
jgi:hypothetical protein